MNHSHICSSCRRRLAQVRPQKIVQWHSRATFISLAVSKPRTSAPSNDESKDDILRLGDNTPDRKGRYAAILPERKRRVPLPKHQSPGDELEALFADVVRSPNPVPQVDTSGFGLAVQEISSRDTSSQGVPLKAMPLPNTPLRSSPHYHSPLQPSIPSLEPYKHIETLKGMLEEPKHTLEAWGFFVKHFGHESPTGSTPLYLSRLASTMRNHLILAKESDPLSEELPTANEISQVFLRIGLLQGWWWSDMTLILIENILKVRKQWPKDECQEEKLTCELLGAWNVVCRPFQKLQYQLPQGSSLDWSYLPLVSTHDVESIARKRGAVSSFGLLTPPFRTQHLGRLPLVTFGTFEILTDESSNVVKALSAEISSFKSLLGRFVALPAFTVEHFGVPTEEKFAKEVWPFVKDNLAAIRKKAFSMCADEQEQKPKREHQPHLAHMGIQTRTSTINKRIYDAVSRRDLASLDLLWGDVIRWPVRQEGAVDGELGGSRTGTMSLELCNLFLLSFMSLRQPDRSIDVWNHLVGCGLVPNLQTWESMLSGCKTARHSAGIEEVWRKMQILKVNPDAKLWTTRISGLIECRQFDQGIRALDEMGRTWLATAKLKHPKKKLTELLLLGDVSSSSPKPTIATVNAAISGLLFWEKVQPAKQILAWASKFGIAPDIITYNTLLKSFVKSGRSEEATSLLQEMSASGIQADVVTFTTILDFTFSSAEDMTPEQQGQLVHSTFESMEQAGVQPNAHTYSKIIYELLQTNKGDLTVVNAVLERMGKQGLEPSPHIFTALMEHYFQQEPTDLDVIRALITRASSVVGSSDHIFWDRVIEGYARIGETGAALKVLSKIHANKSFYSWRAMSTLMIALVQKEEWDVARTLVRNAAKDTGGPIREDVRGSDGQHIFWQNAFELELVDKDIGIGEDYDPSMR